MTIAVTLSITDIKELQRIKAYACQKKHWNRPGRNDSKKTAAPGDFPEYSAIFTPEGLEFRYKVVYSIDQHPEGALFQHMSMSKQSPLGRRQLPTTDEMNVIARLLEMGPALIRSISGEPAAHYISGFEEPTCTEPQD